ncbi:MAG: hypothetical protein HPY69_12865 [Armatimonadetes bacterium]|nr:hypothetical protein [Armatimonadota bacterium]
MSGMRMGPAASWVLLALACLAAYGIGRGLAGVSPTLGLSPALAAEETTRPLFSVREVDVAGLQAGEIVAAERSVLTIAVPAGGLAGYERALIIADRLNRKVQEGARAADFEVRLGDGMGQLVHASGASIFTVTADDAAQAGKSVEDLTREWAAAVWAVLPGEPPSTDPAGAEPAAATAAPAEWVPEEPYEDKYVPILSILRGVRVGVARVNGPRSKVAMTQAVGQLELKFRDVLDIEVYIPLSTKEPGKTLARVQSVGVTGLGDLKL